MFVYLDRFTHRFKKIKRKCDFYGKFISKMSFFKTLFHCLIIFFLYKQLTLHPVESFLSPRSRIFSERVSNIEQPEARKLWENKRNLCWAKRLRTHRRRRQGLSSSRLTFVTRGDELKSDDLWKASSKRSAA